MSELKELENKKKYFFINIENIIECVACLTKAELKHLKHIREAIDIGEYFNGHCSHHSGLCYVCTVLHDTESAKILEIKKLKNCDFEVNSKIVRKILDSFD